MLFEKEKRSLANKTNSNNNIAIRRNSSMLDQENQSKLIEINNFTMNSNFNTNRKGSENNLNNKQQNNNNSKNSNNDANKRKLFF